MISVLNSNERYNMCSRGCGSLISCLRIATFPALAISGNRVSVELMKKCLSLHTGECI
jgi:hypothetical protein